MSIDTKDSLSVVSIPVKHGDATLIRWRPCDGKEFSILVDGGPKTGTVSIVKTLSELKVEEIDLLVLSHTDADHLDGLLELVGEVPILQYWGPCLPAFERHLWLFNKRIQRGIGKARELESKLSQQNTSIRYPLEGLSYRTEDRRLTVSTISPPSRLIERLLIGDDTRSLFLYDPMPQGWLVELMGSVEDDGFRELPADLEQLRTKLRTRTWLEPEDIPSLPNNDLKSPTEAKELADSWASKFNRDPEFFGNSVINDTSIVLSIEARIDWLHNRKVLLTGDLTNWLYLTAKYGSGLKCDVLKAPHHGGVVKIGSTVSYDNVYQLLRPSSVIVSASGKYNLPHNCFRDTVKRWGASLFCPCSRSREYVSTPELKDKSCHKAHYCSQPESVTEITLTGKDTIANRPACVSGFSAEPVHVVRLQQEIIEPSRSLERLTEGEVLRYCKWIQSRLQELHKDRVKVSEGRTPEPIKPKTLRRQAYESGRFRLAADLDTPLEIGTRRGLFWSSFDRMNQADAIYKLPSSNELKDIWDWLSEEDFLLLYIPPGLSHLSADELLGECSIDWLSMQIAIRFGFPQRMCADVIWPRISKLLKEKTSAVYGQARKYVAYETHAGELNSDVGLLLVLNEKNVSSVEAAFKEALGGFLGRGQCRDGCTSVSKPSNVSVRCGGCDEIKTRHCILKAFLAVDADSFRVLW